MKMNNAAWKPRLQSLEYDLPRQAGRFAPDERGRARQAAANPMPRTKQARSVLQSAGNQLNSSKESAWSNPRPPIPANSAIPAIARGFIGIPRAGPEK